MAIKDIIKQKDYLSFRKLEITAREIEVIEKVLEKPKGIVTFTPFLQVRSELPDILLSIILLAGSQYKPTRYARRWMPALCGIFTLQRINSALFNLIEKETSIGQKYKLLQLLNQIELTNIDELWCTDVYDQILPDYYDEIHAKVDKIKNDAELMNQSNNESLSMQIDFLTKEFYENKNIVYRCFIFGILHSGYDRNKILRIKHTMQKEALPMTFYDLEIAARNNQEMEKIIYEEMKWKK